MLDLIVAKALAKSVDDRYASMREFAADLREVRRQLTGASGQRPAFQPAAPAPAAAAATISGRFRKEDAEEEPATPLKLASQFDSFDATVRLAALTQQQEEFRGYISETQKMRAYRGKGAETGPAAAAERADAPLPARAFVTIPRGGDITGRSRAGGPFVEDPFPTGAFVVLGVLGAAALGLIVALLAR